MAAIGYHASHEQLPPSRLLALTRRAEEAGFTAAMCSDHFHPWSERQDHSGFAWSWLGARPGRWPPEDLRHSVLVSADAARYIDWLADYVALGFDEVYVHNVHPDQESFLEAFGQKVLPQLT